MTQLFGLAIFTKKEVMQLLIDEKKASYRKGYKAGAAMKYRHTPKPEVSPVPLSKKDWGHLSGAGEESIFIAPPTVYGDSLPVVEMPEVKVK